MKSILALLVLMIGSLTLLAQKKINFSLSSSCSYYGETVTGDIYDFGSNPEAEEIIGRIVGKVGLEKNFKIMAANVPNAMAVIQNSERYILYSQNFILSIRNATGTEWSGISILAHEVGHHLNGHTIIPGGSRPDLELQADKFSGFVCAKLGATLTQAQAAMNSLASASGSSTHPPKSARVEAIAIGWNQGTSGSNGRITKPVESPQPENRVKVETTDITVAYAGDQFGCGLGIRIKIGNVTFTPTNNSFQVQGVQLGEQYYRITGQINCPTLGGCTVSGSGTVYITEGSTVNVVWQNVAYSQCRVWLQ